MLALAQTPSLRMNYGVRTYVSREELDFSRVLSQHAAYCRGLAHCGVQVRVLEINSHFADGVFIEDTAIVLDEVAILASMGTASRRGEPPGIEPVLREYREVGADRSRGHAGRRRRAPHRQDAAGRPIVPHQRRRRRCLAEIVGRTDIGASGHRSRLPAPEVGLHGVARRPAAGQSGLDRAVRPARVRAGERAGRRAVGAQCRTVGADGLVGRGTRTNGRADREAGLHRSDASIYQSSPKPKEA